MNKNEFHFYRRHLPHWRMKGVIYFITFRTKGTELSEKEQIFVLNTIKESSKKYIKLIAAVVMPDHVHILLTPKKEFTISKIIKGIKGKTAREINLGRNVEGSLWQDEYFDRIMRDEKELFEKINYMWHNPVKKGLTGDTSKYIGWYFNQNFDF